jgi:hypothetical protein
MSERPKPICQGTAELVRDLISSKIERKEKITPGYINSIKQIYIYPDREEHFKNGFGSIYKNRPFQPIRSEKSKK